MSPPGRPKGEYRSAQHEGTPVTRPADDGGHAPERWVLLADGFDANDFLAAWSAWRADPQRSERLHCIAIDAHPPGRAELARRHAESGQDALSAALLQAWPPLAPGLHLLGFEAGKVQLALAVGVWRPWLAELVAQVNHFDLRRTAPDDPGLWRALARLAAPGTTVEVQALEMQAAAPAATRSAQAAGFRIDAEGPTLRATFAPRFVPRPSARAAPPRPAQRHALIVGGGLAGCAAAWALAEQGWTSDVFDRHPAPACEASGNPAGLFHATVHALDGTHARLHRAAALQAANQVGIAIREHAVAGALDGLLRQEHRLDVATMSDLLDRLRLPGDLVRAVDAREASALCGLPQQGPAWFYRGAGWVDPAGLARSYLARAGAASRWRPSVDVAGLRRDGSLWQVLDAQGRVIAAAPTVVLANASDAQRLGGAPDWPVEAVRGQISWFEAGAEAGFEPPRIPLTGSGYALSTPDGRTVFGATAQPGDADPAVRERDHARNLEQLERLLGRSLALRPAQLQGRTAWRCTTRDRLPIVGAMPAADAVAVDPHRFDRPRHVAREPGLFVLSGLGSRGLTWSALAARVLAAAVAGGPAPLGASLLDAIDPARFASRAARRSRAASARSTAQAADAAG